MEKCIQQRNPMANRCRIAAAKPSRNAHNAERLYICERSLQSLCDRTVVPSRFSASATAVGLHRPLRYEAVKIVK